jgi:3-hydroxyisobutyrate dehydrogenase-like beta-hydroxyacid dehydrogenase
MTHHKASARRVAVLGLRGAGGRIAADLARARCTVRGWDPGRRRGAIEGAESAAEAVGGADIAEPGRAWSVRW